MDVKKAEELVKKSHDCIGQIQEIRCKTLAQKTEAE